MDEQGIVTLQQEEKIDHCSVFTADALESRRRRPAVRVANHSLPQLSLPRRPEIPTGGVAVRRANDEPGAGTWANARIPLGNSDPRPTP